MEMNGKKIARDNCHVVMRDAINSDIERNDTEHRNHLLIIAWHYPLGCVTTHSKHSTALSIYLLTSCQVQVYHFVAAFSIRQVTKAFVCEFWAICHAQIKQINTVPKH